LLTDLTLFSFDFIFYCIGLYIKIVRFQIDVTIDTYHEEAAATASPAATKQGYGCDVPEPALPVTLTEPVAPKQSGYPRENPTNPLIIDLQPANEVEVCV
jgi:hypothetical protein